MASGEPGAAAAIMRSEDKASTPLCVGKTRLKKKGAESASAQHLDGFRLCPAASMSRFADRQFGELVLDLQLLALQLDDFRLVGVGVELFFLDFLLERLVAALEFDDMAL
jgi:hypothetical protein